MQATGTSQSYRQLPVLPELFWLLVVDSIGNFFQSKLGDLIAASRLFSSDSVIVSNAILQLFTLIINVIWKGWEFPPAAVDKSFNLRTTSTHRIDHAIIIRRSDVISSMHCLTILKTLTVLWCFQGSFQCNLRLLLFQECATSFLKLWFYFLTLR